MVIGCDSVTIIQLVDFDGGENKTCYSYRKIDAPSNMAHRIRGVTILTRKSCSIYARCRCPFGVVSTNAGVTIIRRYCNLTRHMGHYTYTQKLLLNSSYFPEIH